MELIIIYLIKVTKVHLYCILRQFAQLCSLTSDTVAHSFANSLSLG